MKTILLVLLLASPTLSFAQDKAAATAASFACGPAEIKFDVNADKTQHAVAQAETGKALVYVTEVIERPLGEIRIGGDVTTRVGLDGAWVGANQGNSDLYFSVLPGEHHLCTNWQSKLKRYSNLFALAGFTAEAGKIYYFKTRIRVEDNIPHFKLEPVNDDEGRFLVGASPLSVSHPKK
jgi:hypothetical protein